MNTEDYVVSKMDWNAITKSVDLCRIEKNSILKFSIFRYFSTIESYPTDIQQFAPHQMICIQHAVLYYDLLNTLKFRIGCWIQTECLKGTHDILHMDRFQLFVQQKDDFYKEILVEFHPHAFETYDSIPQILH